MTKDRRSGEGQSDRRCAPRLGPADVPFLKKVEFSKGSKIEIINISRGGLLLETESRLGPNLKIMVKIVTTEGTFKLDGIILRSSVFSLEGPPKYRTAIIFKEPFELMDKAEDVSREGDRQVTGSVIPEKPEEKRPQTVHADKVNEKTPAFVTVVASDHQGVRLKETFTINDW